MKLEMFPLEKNKLMFRLENIGDLYSEEDNKVRY